MINEFNLHEHETLKGYYYIPILNNYVVNKEGDFKYLLDFNKKINFIKIKERSNLFIHVKKDKHITAINVSRLLASTFLQLPKEAENNFNKGVVVFKDDDPLNIKIENLKWITLSEKQNNLWENIYNETKLKYPLDYTQGDGFYPNPIESKEYPGYYRIPIEDDFLLINKDGEVIRLTTHKKAKIGKDVHGYAVINIRIKGSKRPYLIHRFLAMLFIPIPIRHADKTFDELEVNHIDAIKENNKLSNLEWLTSQENKDHAHSLNLNTERIPVVSRNIKTGEIIKYESLFKCCKENFIDKNMLRKHILSFTAGRIIYNDLVFKLDNESEWPAMLAHEHPETDLWKTCDVVAKNLTTNQICLFISLRQACSVLNLSHTTLQNVRHRKGNDVPYNGWIFYPLTNNVFI